MKAIKIKDLIDRLPEQMEIHIEAGSSILITRLRRGTDMKCSYPLLTDPGTGTPVVMVECGKPASVVMGDKWLCERHANMVLEDD